MNQNEMEKLNKAMPVENNKQQETSTENADTNKKIEELNNELKYLNKQLKEAVGTVSEETYKEMIMERLKAVNALEGKGKEKVVRKKGEQIYKDKDITVEKLTSSESDSGFGKPKEEDLERIKKIKGNILKI